MSGSRGRVLVAMSGGVDSSVAAALLVRQGYEVIGAFMRLGWPAGDVAGEAESDHQDGARLRTSCCSLRAAVDARKVAAALGIPLYVLDFQEEFARIVDYFVDEYNRGRTPNPCVRCNEWLKFGKLLAYADAVQAQHIATGHYARVRRDGRTGRMLLLRGRDVVKDQSYVLAGLNRAVLERVLFPLGRHHKDNVRLMARRLNLPVHDKRDSQEICFVPDHDYAGLLRRRTPHAFVPGELVDVQGQVLGVHGGHQHFTIGQRKGIGLALGQPVYVVDIDARTNRVTVGQRQLLQCTGLLACQVNWLCEPPAPGSAICCLAKIRSRHEAAPASANVQGDARVLVHFHQPQDAVTPGQFVVLYDGQVVLGGGWIERAIPAGPV